MKQQKPETETAPASTSALATFGDGVKNVLDPSQFKRVRRLTRDVTTITRLGQAIVQCQSELYTIDMDDPANPAQKRPVPACDVLDCLTGTEMVLICGAVLTSAWRRFGEPLTGNYFAIKCGEIAAGKRYRNTEVIFLELSE
jgi:hypothetical protein